MGYIEIGAGEIANCATRRCGWVQGVIDRAVRAEAVAAEAAEAVAAEAAEAVAAEAAEAVEAVAAEIARLAEIANLDVTQLPNLADPATPCDWMLLSDGVCCWLARASELSEAATDELLAVQRGDISDPDCAAWTDWCDAHPAYREADVPAPILTAALAHLDREAGEAVCTGW